METQKISWSKFERRVLEISKPYDPDPNVSDYRIFINNLSEEQSKELYKKLEEMIKEEKYQKYVRLEGPSCDYMRSTFEKEIKIIEVAKIEE